MRAADHPGADSKQALRSSDGTLEELLAGGWGFHGWTADDSLEIGVSPEVLAFIVEHVRPGDRTLETGSGYSTIAFALAGAEHTAVSPAPWEHERIRRWCDERDVSLASVTLIEGLSQEILPGLSPEPLDLALIDGDHSFPTVFVDFYYSANRLRRGGLLVVDDTHIRTGDILRRFLESESKTGRWRLERRFPTTVAFVKLTETLIELGGWASQPYCAKPLALPGTPLWPRVRRQVRLRTRLRELPDRLRRRQ